jgi:hypothetical protein
MLVPIANVILGINLLARRGTGGTNDYGEDPLLVNDKTEPDIIRRKVL